MIGVDGLSVRFGSGQAVRNASFTIEPGDLLGIVGESGCGKSVLALSLMGMLPDTARMTGSLRIDGRDMSSAGEKDWQNLRARRLAMIFQEPMTALNPVFTVGRQLTEGLRLHKNMSRAEADARALELLRDVRIPEPDRRMSQ